MAETRFIRTVAFGGYDREEVIRKLEFLNTQVYDLKNELRETKLFLDAYKKGTEEEKIRETVLAGERTKLTSVQVQNETLSTKLKATEDENKSLSKELEELKASAAEMAKKLEDANSKLSALQSGSDAAALSTVFIEAQKSANSLVENAKVQAAEMEEKSRQTALEIIEEADNSAAKIIYEAEKNAAVTNADAMNKAEEMKVASNNLRAVMLEDLKLLSGEVESLKSVLESFEKKGMAKLTDSQQLLNATRNRLTEGGVPTFTVPQTYEAQMPEPPVMKKTAAEAKTAEKKKSNSQLDALKEMADSIDGSQTKGGSDLADLAKQAQAIANGGKAGAAPDLSELAKQAEVLGGSQNKSGGSKKNSGGVDLAELAKQAAALGGEKK